MARSVALNPASLPFFPGGLRGTDEDSIISLGSAHHREASSRSSLSMSPTDYRSVKSSPSPSPFDRGDFMRHQASPGPSEGSRFSPTVRQVDTGKCYPNIESRVTREASSLGILDTLPEADDSQEDLPSEAKNPVGSGAQTPSPTVPTSHQVGRERLTTPPSVTATNTSTAFVSAITSSSPVSSLSSSSQFAGSGVVDIHLSAFDIQLKSSPFMHEILDRLVRCEYNTREIQRDLVDIHRKVNLLLERALTTQAHHQQPEFKDPFATTNGTAFVSSLGQPRPSMGNIPPNQHAPSAEDMPTITQRLNALTTSVGQLLTLQTQQMQTQQIQPTLSLEGRNSVISLNPPQDLATNQLMAPSALSPPSLIGHTLSNRPDLRPTPRQPNPPMRTWSAGTLDLPIRATESPISRQEPLLRDKPRRSVSGLLRRDSSGVLDGGDHGRDNGPIITKWEQLPLAPELLRSLNKFGVGPPNKIQQRALPFLLRGADIIAQAPPTQERIAAYVIPAIQIAIANMSVRTPQRGPIVIMVSTTVDQATQAQRMIRDIGGPIGVKSALGVGTNVAQGELTQELRLLQQNIPHIICGTPQKLHALFTTSGGLGGSEVRFLVLDEVDQLIARNLHDFVFNIVKLLPAPRSRPLAANIPTSANTSIGLLETLNSGRRLSTIPGLPGVQEISPLSQTIERQTALFSNTVPQDVLNLATAIQLREPVRVLVRRDGNVSNPEGSQGTRGLRQYYLYLAFAAAGRPDNGSVTGSNGLGIIGSGRIASAETAQAREWKLDALADLFEDIEIGQAVVHVGSMTTLDSIVYKLASRGLEAIPLHGEMNSGTKLAALNKFRSPSTSVLIRQPPVKVLVVFDIQTKSPEVGHVPLVINYDLPKVVEEYAHRVAPAIAPNYARPGVVVNFVTAAGGDVEMLRSIECYYKIKCPEVPMSLREIF